ncbi:MAG: tetratricopeptide repeat protein [Bacteroidia bacterium]|nr:tetratricopeptide repeat protein [Bacteroidia bacterium]
MKIKYFLTFTLFLSVLIFKGFSGVSVAQNRNIDSLLTLLKTDKPDTNKVNHLNKLCREYIDIGEHVNSIKYGNKALALARCLTVDNKIGWAKGIALAYNYIGNIYSDQGNYHGALENHLASLKLRIAIGDKQSVATSYNNIGAIYFNQGNYAEALKNNFESLKIKEKIGDKQGIADSYNNIGFIYHTQSNNPEALKNHFASLKILKEIGDKKGIAFSYNNIGIIYQSQGNFLEALKNYFASLNIFTETDHKQGIATSHNNIGAIYFNQGKYPEALKNYFISLKIRQNIGDKRGIATSFMNISDVYKRLKKLKEARNCLNDALQINSEIGNIERIKTNYYSLSQLDSTEGNWKAAYQHHKLFIIYKDSIDNKETKKKTTEIILTNKFEKQEAASKAEQDKKDTITSANKKRQELILILVSIVLILVFIFAGFVVRSLRITRKQKRIIELQKNEVSHQKEMVLEKNKEITDSINYAQRIQRALLASDKMLDAYLFKGNSGLVSESKKLLRDIHHDRDYFIFFQPKDIVSGDFYWAAPLANGNFALVTADSTGHGVPGAIMSMLNISCLNEAVKGQQLTEPNEILNYTRSKIIEHLSNDGSAEGGKDGMDCSLISFDFNINSSIGEAPGGKLTFSAANNPIWIVRKKQIIELEPDKMPVGKHTQDSIPFTQHTIELEKGDIVYVITDGMPDQFGGPKGKKFMSKQLKELLISISHLPMKEQKERLSDEFSLWKGNLEQVDDVTIIGIRI